MRRRQWPPIVVLATLAGCFGLIGCRNEADPPTSKEDAAAASSGSEAAVDREAIETALAAANDYLNRLDLSEAEIILEKLIERAPREVRAHELMGQVLSLKADQALRGGDVDAAGAVRGQAYEHYRQACQIEPDSAGLQQSAGVMAMAAGRIDAALAHFTEAAHLDGANPQHPLYAAQILIQQKRYAEATDSLDRVLALDPDEPLAHASLAMIALEENRFEPSLAHIAQARQIAPGDLRFRVQEAKIHRRAGDPSRALELLTGLPAAERADGGITVEIAAAYTDLGEHEKAAEAWAHRYRQRPTDRLAYLAAVRAGEAYLRAGRRGAAELWLEQALIAGGGAGGGAPEVRALQAALEGG